MQSFGKTSDGVETFAVTIKPKLPESLKTGPDAKVLEECRAVFISYGACMQQLWLPGKTDTKGKQSQALTLADCVLGYPDIASYEKNVPYQGACVGRVAGRIGNGRFSIPIELDPSISTMYKIPRNLKNAHCLHGGLVGLTYRPWEVVEVKSDSVKFSVESPHGDDGFPGTLTVYVTYKLAINDEFGIDLHMDYHATISGGICPINLTNHAYYNLSGHLSGPSAMDRHVVCLQADKMCELEGELFPTGRMMNVGKVPGTDLRKPTALKKSLTMIHPPPFQGFDDFYAFKELPESEPKITVKDPVSGRKLELFTDQLGVQFYSGNFLDPKTDPKGKDGFSYPQHSGLCMEAQGYPDAVNRNNFPKMFIAPGKPYAQDRKSVV